MNRPITYKHLFYTLVLGLGFWALGLIIYNSYQLWYDDIYNQGCADGAQQDYTNGYQDATDDINRSYTLIKKPPPKLQPGQTMGYSIRGSLTSCGDTEKFWEDLHSND